MIHITHIDIHITNHSNNTNDDTIDDKTRRPARCAARTASCRVPRSQPQRFSKLALPIELNYSYVFLSNSLIKQTHSLIKQTSNVSNLVILLNRLGYPGLWLGSGVPISALQGRRAAGRPAQRQRRSGGSKKRVGISTSTRY